MIGFRDNEKKTKAVCADHPYSKRKSKDEGSADKSDAENDSSADEAPHKRIKVDAVRTVTNQRTGVPVTGSSASDDSCQSQPAKTPPYSSGSQIPTTPTMTPSSAIATLGKPDKTSTPFSMDNLLKDVINKDVKDAKVSFSVEGGILSKLDELDKTSGA